MNESNLQSELGLKYPVYWNLWAIDPTFAHHLIFKILTLRPSVIVECGGGLSTVIALKTLKNLGIKHTLYSFDSDEWFIRETKNLLVSEGLYDEKNVKLVHAPIDDVHIRGKTYKWYKFDKKILKFKKIDLLVVDGPAGSVSKEARYPAVPFFLPYLETDSSVMLDDFSREDERNIAKRWLEENKNLEFLYRHESDKGSAEMIFRDKSRRPLFRTLPEPADKTEPAAGETKRLQDELSSVYNSRSWKIGHHLAKVYGRINPDK
jgi:hypothetical protein